MHKVRSRLEARRLLRAGKGLPADARVLDVGCGDGFHLDLLRRYAPPSWSVTGVDTDARAVAAARARGLDVYEGAVETSPIQPNSIDMALCIQTIEHVPDPIALLSSIANLLKPGGRLYLITDNTGSPDFRLTKGRHWGGYHFPRHWNLFNKESMRPRRAPPGSKFFAHDNRQPSQLDVLDPHALVDWRAPRVAVNQFSLPAAPASPRSPLSTPRSPSQVEGRCCELSCAGHDDHAKQRSPGRGDRRRNCRTAFPAHELERHGIDAQVYEAGPRAAGMAATHLDADGFSYDVGAHFMTNRFLAAVGMGSSARLVPRYAEVVRLGDGSYPRYPIGLLGVPRFVASAARERLTRPPRDLSIAADRFRREYGPALADEVALPLLEAWSGRPADQLSASVIDKIPTSIAQTIFLRAAQRVTNAP